MIQSRRRLALLLLILAVGLLWLPALASAAPPPQTGPSAPTSAPPGGQSLDLSLAAEPAYEGVYRPGSWLPVRVSLANSGVDRAVEVRVGVREGAQYAAEVELPNGGQKSVTIYVYMPGSSRRLVVRALSGGQELLSQSLDLRPAGVRARVVGLISGGPALQLPPRLPDGGALAAVPLAPADLPEHPLGLSTFDTIVLDDAPTAELSEPQRAALDQWVLRGGQLLLSGGPGIERSLAGLPSPMRPADFAGVAAVAATDLLGPAGAGAAELPLATLTPRPGPDGRVPYHAPIAGLAAGQTLLLEQSYGRGVVSLSAVPLAHPALLAWERRDQLWADLLRSPNQLPAGFAPDGVSLDGFIEGNMASSLTGMPALEFPPMLALGGLLIAYIVVVGPGVFLLLRRLDRLALGWVVVPVVTLLFAGAAYALGYAQRGGDVVVNQVTLVEELDDVGSARVRSFAGLFSPSRTSYLIDASDVAGGEAALLLRPISLQGVWDGGGGPGAAGGVFVQESAAGTQARDFEVAQWSMRAVTTDTIGASSGVDSRITLEGGKLRGEVTNRGTRPLSDVTLIQGDRVLRLGDIGPGETRSGELARRENLGGGMFGGGGTPLSYLVYGPEMDRNSKSGGQPLPPELQVRVRLLDALFAYGPAPRDSQPILIAWSREPGLELAPAERKVERQQMAVITARPRLVMADAAFELPQGWLSPRYEGGQGNVCFGAMGSGITLGFDPVVVELGLPRDLYGLRPSALTLLTGADGAWSPETTVELYDWLGGDWVRQNAQGKPLELDEPERFLSGHGKIRARISTTLAQPNFNCVYVDATLKGSLQ